MPFASFGLMVNDFYTSAYYFQSKEQKMFLFVFYVLQNGKYVKWNSIVGQTRRCFVFDGPHLRGHEYQMNFSDFFLFFFLIF
jgi:hypothetical protein